MCAQTKEPALLDLPMEQAPLLIMFDNLPEEYPKKDYVNIQIIKLLNPIYKRKRIFINS